MFSLPVVFDVLVVVVVGGVALRVFRPKLHATYTPYAHRAGHELPASAAWPREPLPDDPALTYTGDPDLEVDYFDEPARPAVAAAVPATSWPSSWCSGTRRC